MCTKEYRWDTYMLLYRKISALFQTVNFQDPIIYEISENCSTSLKVCVLGHSDSMCPYDPQPTSLLCLWDSPGKNNGVDCHALLQEIFPNQGPKPSLLHCKGILHCLNHQGSPHKWKEVLKSSPPIFTWLLKLSVIWGWPEHVTFLAHFISIIITSAPPQINRR